MYLSGLISIDPSHLTQTCRRPTQGFRRFAEVLTAGLLAEKEERETFTALAILQEINLALREMSISDVVRFTKDGHVIYDDSDGQDNDDMPLVLSDLSRSSSGAQPAQFESLSLLLEHHLPSITLIIELKVTRRHRVGEFPIQIIVNGLVTQLQASGDESELAQRLEQAFADQETYDRLQESVKQEFETFLMQLEDAVRKHMKLDDLHRHTHVNILRPTQVELADANRHASQPANDPAPVFQRYQADSSPFLYCWMWSSMMHSNNIHCQDVRIVDEQGQGLVDVGQEGFDAGSNDLLNAEEPFAGEDASELGLQPIGDAESRFSGFFEGGDSADGGGWLDSFGSDGGGFDGGGFD